MHINKLNDDCFILILRRFSLRELIRLRIICGRWFAVIQIVAREKKTLKLFGSFRDLDDYCRSLLQYNLEEDAYFKLSSLSNHDEIFGVGYNTKLSVNFGNKKSKTVHHDASFNFLAQLFPNIKKLIVCDRYQDLSTFGAYGTTWKSLVQLDLNYLLSQWNSLTDLSLFMFPTKKVLSSLCAITFESLKRFEFFKTSRYFAPGSDDNVGICNIMNILSTSTWSRLEYLSFGSNACDMVFIFPRLGPNLKHLNLYHCSYSDLTTLQNVNPEIVSKLTRLTINSNGFDFQKSLEFVCKNFVSLQFFCFMPSRDASFDNIIENVSELKSLSELRVCFYADYSSRNTRHTRLFAIKAETLKKYRFASIKKLQLKNYDVLCNPKFPLSSWIFDLFPELNHLSISEQCKTTLFTRMLKSLTAFEQTLKKSKRSYPKVNLYSISLEDDLSRLIAPYERLYKQFKGDRKSTNTYRPRYGAYYRRYNRYDDNSDSDEDQNDDSDNNSEQIDSADGSEQSEEETDNSDVEIIEEYPVDDNGVILID